MSDESSIHAFANRMSRNWRWSALVCGTLAIPIALFLSLRLGARPISSPVILKALTHSDGSYDQLVILLMRLPRAALAFVVGAALAVAGSLMQALTRNPMGSPDILGVNAGAALGVITASVLLTGASRMEYAFASFIGAAIIVSVVYAVAALSGEGPSSVSLIIAGTVVGAALSSITSIILVHHARYQDQSKWLLGSLVGADWNLFRAESPILVTGFALALFLAPHLNTLSLGESVAQGLGMNTRQISVLVTVATLLLAGGSVAAAGPIGFVGLMLPHMLRGIFGCDHRWLIPCSAVFGGLFLLISDILARALLAPVEMPVGLVTALLGGPFFLVLARSRRIAR